MCQLADKPGILATTLPVRTPWLFAFLGSQLCYRYVVLRVTDLDLRPKLLPVNYSLISGKEFHKFLKLNLCVA